MEYNLYKSQKFLYNYAQFLLFFDDGGALCPETHDLRMDVV